MSRFAELLRRTADRLEIPQPARSRVLLELAGDLEDSFDHYRGLGLEEAEAERKVEERFDVSDEVLAQLVRLHHPAFRRWLDRFSVQAQSLWERVMLTVILLFVVAMTGSQLFSTSFFDDASASVWPAVISAIVAVGIFLAKGYQLFIKKDHEIRHLRTLLPTLMITACASLFVGVFGYFLGLYLAMIRMAVDMERSGYYLTVWLMGSTATMIVCLLVAILAALFWFVLMAKVRRIESAEATLLLEGAP
jgi:hypothetical protein